MEKESGIWFFSGSHLSTVFESAYIAYHISVTYRYYSKINSQ